MSIQVLLSTMNQNDFRLVEKCNIKTNAIIINQCNKEKIVEKEFPFGIIKMICRKEKGLSKSRNLALKYATEDICILCDDDIKYRNGYERIVEKAFKDNKNADIIIFNINSINTDKRKKEKKFNKIKKLPFYKTYSSVHIAFRRKSIINNKIQFNTDFGAGSGLYSMAEDSIFINDARRKKLSIITYPACIADLYTEKSSWFNGFDRKYFFDTGAFLAAGHPGCKNILKWYYPIKLHKKTSLKTSEIVRLINDGMKGYEKKIPYNRFYTGHKQ